MIQIRRTKQKTFWLTEEENKDFQEKAKRTCLSEAALLRLLIRGYEPRERPGKEFYTAMQQLSAIGNNINQLAAKANSLGFIDAEALSAEAKVWHRFQSEIESHFLRPVDGRKKWQ